MKVALVVVDLQEDFLPSDGALAVADGRSIIQPICKLFEYPWDAVIATQDWHPPDHISFASQHQAEPFTEVEFQHPQGRRDASGAVETATQVVWPDHCVQNTVGSSIDASFLACYNQLDGIIPKTIVRKGYLKDREYYSCFADSWGLHHTEMEQTLRRLGITDVVFVGLAYDFCVKFSAVDCAGAGFSAYVVKDLCRSVYPENVDAADAAYKSGNVEVLDHFDPRRFFT